MAAELKNLTIGIIVLGLLVIGVSNFYLGFAGSYSIANATNFSSLSKTNTTLSMISNATSKIQNQTTLGDVSLLDMPLLVAQGIQAALLTAFGAVDIGFSLISDFVGLSNLPIGWVVNILVAVIWIIILFAIIKATQKVEV